VDKIFQSYRYKDSVAPESVVISSRCDKVPFGLAFEEE
jgi:hypothetical protein